MRLIDADDLLGILNDLASGGAVSIKISEVIYFLKRMPTRDGKRFESEPVRHGKWISLEPEIGLYSCSLCEHNILRAKCNFCPNCGAKMG